MITTGSRAQVMHGTAKKTSGGLTKKQLKYNKQGKIVSKKASALAKKNNRLVKAGYITRKGIFGVSMMGGMPGLFEDYTSDDNSGDNNPVQTSSLLALHSLEAPPSPVASKKQKYTNPSSTTVSSTTGPNTPHPNNHHPNNHQPNNPRSNNHANPNIPRTPPARTTETDLSRVKIPSIECDEFTTSKTFDFYNKLGEVSYKMFDESLLSTIKGRGEKACWYIGLAQFEPTDTLLETDFPPIITSTRQFNDMAKKYFGKQVNTEYDNATIVEVLKNYNFKQGAIICSINPESGYHVVKICNICGNDIIFACSKELGYIKTTLEEFKLLNIQYIVYEKSGN
tara:strand:- start:3617 stop:4633 length:1017 start_codon:yes stop_codon:yes gene_type:complete